MRVCTIISHPSMWCVRVPESLLAMGEGWVCSVLVLSSSFSLKVWHKITKRSCCPCWNSVDLWQGKLSKMCRKTSCHLGFQNIYFILHNVDTTKRYCLEFAFPMCHKKLDYHIIIGKAFFFLLAKFKASENGLQDGMLKNIWRVFRGKENMNPLMCFIQLY